jgi:hypothetical protein
MSASNLVTFAEAQDAPRLLTSGEAEFLVMDRLPAEEYSEPGDIKMVAHGLNPQLYGIVMPVGATTLAWEINRALGQLQEEGTIGAIAEEYLGLSSGQMLPTPMPGAEALAEGEGPPSEGCIDSMAFVEELSEGGSELSPGETFARVFRVRNTGTCDWGEGYVFDYGGGNVEAARMAGEPTPITEVVPAGDVYELELNLTAPEESGDYQAFWYMLDPRGVSFGERLYVSVVVK